MGWSVNVQFDIDGRIRLNRLVEGGGAGPGSDQ